MNLYARLAHLAQYQATKVAVETSRSRTTYAELELLARRLAGGLRQAGIGPGSIVGLRLRETPDHIAALFAAMRMGATALPLDWRNTRSEFVRICERFRPTVVLSDDSPNADWPPAMLGIAGLLNSDPDAAAPAEPAGGPLILSLTSGTTGIPKAMIVTHENIFARTANRALEGMFAKEDRFLNTLPLAYTAGREHSLSTILMGGTLVLFPTLFGPAELISYVNQQGITGLNLSPNMSRSILNAHRDDGHLSMPNLRVLISTTGKLEPTERSAIRERVSPSLIDYYGSTGTGLISVIARVEDGSEPTAVGRPALGVEVEIADLAGNPMPPGEVGRIRVRGPNVATPMPGPPGSDDEGFREGWYYPGDLGRIDKNGILHLHGRAADLIKRGGLMVHAQEVEQALCRHASVADAAVVGAPSPNLGQEVVAFVVTRRQLEARELVQYCRTELAPYKIPSRFFFVDSLPRNANGKVVKPELLARLQETTWSHGAAMTPGL